MSLNASNQLALFDRRRILALGLVAVVAIPGVFQPATTWGQSKPDARKGGDEKLPGTGINENVEENYNSLQLFYIRLLEEFAKQIPSGKKSARENMYGGLAMIWIAVLSEQIALPTAGMLVGGAVGALAEGVGAAPGAAIGLGGGIVVSGSHLIATAVATIPVIEYIESKYPATASAPTARGALAAGGVYAMAAPGLAPAAAKQAGPYESLFIHLISSGFTRKIIDFAKAWDQSKQLPPAVRAKLRELNFARPAIEKLAYIVEHERISPNSPKAAPLSGFLRTVVGFLSADNAAIEQSWLDALGAGATTAKVDGSKLELQLPPVLRAVGAPAKVSVNLPSIANVKIGGNGGPLDPYLKASIDWGTFSFTSGDAELVKSGAKAGKIRVEFGAKKATKITSLSLRYKWNNQPEQGLGISVSPELASKLAVSVYFEVENGMLLVDAVSFGDVRIDVPKFDIPEPIKSAVDQIAKDVSKKVDDVVQGVVKALGFKDAFEKTATSSMKSLSNAVASSAKSEGWKSVAKVESLGVHAGKLRAKVHGERLEFPTLPDSDATRETIRKVQSQIVSKRPTDLRRVPGTGVGGQIGRVK
jgi:hypothetical protein